MNKNYTYTLGAAMISLGAALLQPALAQTGTVPTPPTSPVVPSPIMQPAPGGVMHHGDNDKHPALRTARRHLEMAKNELMKASTDYSGHRTAAINAIDTAINEIDTAMRTDNAK